MPNSETIPMAVRGCRLKDDAPDMFSTYSKGFVTGRDPILWNFSKTKLVSMVEKAVAEYDLLVDACQIEVGKRLSMIDDPGRDDEKQAMEETFERMTRSVVYKERPTLDMIWTVPLLNKLKRKRRTAYRGDRIRAGSYFPRVPMWYYDDKILCDSRRNMDDIFPVEGIPNVVMVCHYGFRKGFSVFATDRVYSSSFMMGGAGFPLYRYEKVGENTKLTKDDIVIDGYRRLWAIKPGAMAVFRKKYGPSIKEEDVFLYTYGVLNSDYAKKLYAELPRTEFPEIPLLEDFEAFRDAGRRLMELHLGKLAEFKVGGDVPWSFELNGKPVKPGDAALKKWDSTTLSNFKLSKSQLAADLGGGLMLKGLSEADFETNKLAGKPLFAWILESFSQGRDPGVPEKFRTWDAADWREESEGAFFEALIEALAMARYGKDIASKLPGC